MGTNYDVKNFFPKKIARTGIALFADIIKTVTMFVKTILKDSRKVRRIRNHISKWNLYLYFLIEQNLMISSKKADVSRTPGVCHVIRIVFGSSLGKV